MHVLVFFLLVQGLAINNWCDLLFTVADKCKRIQVTSHLSF